MTATRRAATFGTNILLPLARCGMADDDEAAKAALHVKINGWLAEGGAPEAARRGPGCPVGARPAPGGMPVAALELSVQLE